MHNALFINTALANKGFETMCELDLSTTQTGIYFYKYPQGIEEAKKYIINKHYAGLTNLYNMNKIDYAIPTKPLTSAFLVTLQKTFSKLYIQV